MADFSLGGGPPTFEEGLTLATVSGVAVTANVSTDTVGAYAEIVTAASNTVSTDLLSIILHGVQVAGDYLVTIALGEAGSEVDIIDDIWTFLNNNQVSGKFRLPFKIPAGVRISAKCQSSISSGVINVIIDRQAKSFQSRGGFGKVLTIGANTTTTSGVQVSRAGAGVFGSWVEMTSSLTETVKGFLVAAHRESVASWTTGRLVYQVGVGSAGNEEILTTLFINISGSEISTFHISEFQEVSIASGERVSIRAASDLSNGDFDLNYVLYGVC